MWVQFCLYIFLDGVGEGGSEQVERMVASQPEGPGRICVLMERKNAFIYLALNTGFPLTAVAGLFSICSKGVEVLPEIALTSSICAECYDSPALGIRLLNFKWFQSLRW